MTLNVFKCETCQKTFASKQRLNSHVQRKTKCKPPPVYTDRIAVNFVLQGISYETLIKLIGSDKIVSSQYVNIENQKELGDNLPPLAVNIVKQTEKKEETTTEQAVNVVKTEKKKEATTEQASTQMFLTEKDGELFDKQKEKMVEQIQEEYKKENKEVSKKFKSDTVISNKRKELKKARDYKLRLLNKRKRLPNTNLSAPQQPTPPTQLQEEQEQSTETIEQLKVKIHELDKSMATLRQQAEDEAERQNKMTAHCRELLEQVTKKQKERLQLMKRIKQVEKQRN